MNILKIFIKSFYTYVFTVDKKIINNCKVRNSKKDHIRSRLYIVLPLIIFFYIICISYIGETFTLFNIFRTFLFFLVFRIIAKEFTDYIIVMFFYKSFYKYTLKDARKRKIKRFNRLKYKILK
jgi:phosphatidylserine synthase